MLDHLDRHPIVLTPHVTVPYEDDKHPDEISLLQSGTYNLGFLAVADHPTTRRFLRWWGDRLFTGCVRDGGRGLFVDQKWVNQAPGYFEGVLVLRDSGYNVAYWNLHERKVSRRGGEVLVNNSVPCAFYHFSGFDYDDAACVSRYQNRFRMEDIGDAADLYRVYRTSLQAQGHAESRHWPYAFAAFENGVRIPDLARRYVLHQPDAPGAENPFAAGGGSFLEWFMHFEGCALSPLLEEIYRLRADLRLRYPAAAGADRAAFLGWACESAGREFGLDAALLRKARRSPRRRKRPQVPRSSRGSRCWCGWSLA